ncbi:uncharacterized protein LOC110716111 [Chenopodium quinoa]|uniref:uncharacterized protein LOC110716111 n=1 Tax=Chenopodium quinoa TaxID=63459 RepID=UPI000B789F88|nr:uncharacterized protein LOC110716111 [Chenopodium quinoa]
MEVEHLVRYKSDHAALLLRKKGERKKKKDKTKSFKFKTSWLLEDSCERTVREAWVRSEGCTTVERIATVARCLGMWSSKKFQNLDKQIDDAESTLNSAQAQRSSVESGVWSLDEEKIEGIITKHFEALLSSLTPSDLDIQEALENINPSITPAINAELMKPFTKDEILEALKQMHPCKAPGPDGMHAVFYQRFWHIIGDEVTSFVTSILLGFSSLKHVNNTNIVLIPKVTSPTITTEYLPIALCNVLYKLVSKSIVMRLKNILPDIISENQSAFVPGRLITDNALIALEISHTMKNMSKSKKWTIAMKLDMSKAYDKVEWGFLRKLLLTMGFDGRWKINYEKSEVSFSKGVPIEKREGLMEILHMRQVDRHEKYFGIPTNVGRSKKVIFEAVFDRIWKKLQGWKEKLLFRAGKEIILKFVIQAIPTYLMGVYKFSSLIIQRIHSAMARFWWGSSEGKRKIHWKNWDYMCTLKCLGGMGFRDLSVFNDALLGRKAWRLATAPSSFLCRVFKAKYYPHSDFLDSYLGYAGSYSWRSIWSSKAIVKEGVLWKVGNGRNINLWSDPWVADEDGRFILSEESDSLSRVSDLIDADRKEWKYNILDEYFNDRDVRCVLEIPLSEGDCEDEISWAFSKTWDYIVSSSY